jgi:hypothetical protein
LGVHIIIRIFEKLEDLLHGMSLPRWNSAAKAAHQSASLYAVGESGKTPDRWTPFVDVTQTCCQSWKRTRSERAFVTCPFPYRFAAGAVRDVAHVLAHSFSPAVGCRLREIYRLMNQFPNVERPVIGF